MHIYKNGQLQVDNPETSQFTKEISNCAFYLLSQPTNNVRETIFCVF